MKSKSYEIKIFKLDSMDNTPFNSSKKLISFLSENGIEFTDKIRDSDVLISQVFSKKMMLNMIRYRNEKSYLIWTHEPRYNVYFKSKLQPLPILPSAHVMNVYTGDIYINNFTVWGYCINKYLDPIDIHSFSLKDRKIVALMSSYKGQKTRLIKDGEDIDLICSRNKIALLGNKLGKLDIYGRGWPKGLSLEDSRANKWRGRKFEILGKYNFNLCFENTNHPYYVTEKIWDSIKGYCLPIYYGRNNSIYETFPKGSFLDYAEFKNPESLFDYIDSMTTEEFIERFNLCIKCFNEFYKRGYDYWELLYAEMLQNIVEKIKLAVLEN